MNLVFAYKGKHEYMHFPGIVRSVNGAAFAWNSGDVHHLCFVVCFAKTADFPFRRRGLSIERSPEE